MIKLHTIRSGGQTGADQAGLYVGKKFGLKTGGLMPKGFKTLDGPRPEFAKLYGIKEHHSADYVPRTILNTKDSDGTIRLAGNFSSRGEICTLRGIKKHKKPYFDVQLDDPPPVGEFIKWLDYNNIGILNVAGNAEQTFLGAYRMSVNFLTEAMFEMGFKMYLTKEILLDALGLSAIDEKSLLAFRWDSHLERDQIYRGIEGYVYGAERQGS